MGWFWTFLPLIWLNLSELLGLSLHNPYCENPMMNVFSPNSGKCHWLFVYSYRNFVHLGHTDNSLRHRKHAANSCIYFRHNRWCHCRISHSLIHRFDPNNRHDRRTSNRPECIEFYCHTKNQNKLHVFFAHQANEWVYMERMTKMKKKQLKSVSFRKFTIKD